nr:hypothetical protein [uncultured Flavobacterium sp.]
MKTSKHTNLDLKLHELNNEKLKEKHSEELGLHVPEDYFSNSKSEILSKVLTKKEPKLISIYRKRNIWIAAASIVLVFGLTVLKPFSVLNFNDSSIVVVDSVDNASVAKVVAADSPAVYQKNNQTDLVSTKESGNGVISEHVESAENDIVVESLFMEENEINESVNNYMLEDI